MKTERVCICKVWGDVCWEVPLEDEVEELAEIFVDGSALQVDEVNEGVDGVTGSSCRPSFVFPAD